MNIGKIIDVNIDSSLPESRAQKVGIKKVISARKTCAAIMITITALIAHKLLLHSEFY